MSAGDIQLLETLSESPRSVVVRGLDKAGRVVVVKRAAPMLAPAEGRSRLLHERTIYEHVASPRMLRLLDFVDQPDGAALVFEDSACGSLTRHAHAHPLSVLDSLRVTLGVLEALAILHRAHVVHRDVKPDNVLVDHTLSRVLLIDFGIATVVQRATGTTSTRGRLEGTVEFMAPELTGRVNLDVDYRSDYYCLGASLYWMLAGEPPFVGLGISELVHAHIARVPARLDERDPAIPGPVASIVAKLLAKSPDQRYQGAFGLRRDLERCIAALERGLQIEDFELAERDPSQQLQLAQRLYGRERERAALDAAREQTRQTKTPQLVVIAGPAGCGKSRLVEEFRERLDRERLHFIEHRVEARPSEPMAVVKHTLSRLLRSYERSSDALLDEVHQRLHDQLDETGAALAEVLPELEQILGRRPQLPPVDPGAARARLLASIGRFADALMLPGHEYVLFIDDLQWADEASLHLVEQLLAGRRSVLVLATLRDDGTSLAEVRARIQAMAGEHHTLELGPLDQVAVLEWAQELLGGAAEAPAFAELLSMRTGGTPMFIEQFVVALHDAGAIGIDHTSGRWTVDLERARGQASSGGVVEFLVGRLRELPARSLEVLGLAALLGPRFEGATLAALAGRDEADVATALHEAIVAGFVSASHDEIGSTYDFAHERIRHAAAQSVVGDPARLHLRIARRMLEADPSASNPETLHAVVNHLGEVVGEAVGEAVELLRDPEERGRFADLCVRAATHARAAAAFAGAARHYDAATHLLDDDTCHEPLFEAQLGRAESLCMAGELERGVAAYVELAAIIRTRHERIRVLLSRELVHMFSEDLESCLQILVEAAGLFELDLRRGGSSEWVGGLMQQVLDTLATRTAASIIDGPRVSDPELEMLLALLLAATNPAYVCGDLNLMTALTLTIIALSLEHGCSDATATAFVQLALLSATALHDFEGARRWSQLGFALFEHFPTSVLRSGATMVHAGTVQPWIAPLEPHDPALREAFHQLRNAGMFTEAGYATNTMCQHELLLGAPLEDTLEDATATTTFHAGIGATVLAQVSASTARACRILLDPGATSAELVPHDSGGTGGAGKAEAFFADFYPTAVYQFHINAAFVAWMLRDDEALRRAIAAGSPVRMAGTGLFSTGLFDLFESMLACARYASDDTLDEDGRRELAAGIEARFAQFQRWEASCPSNAMPLRLLLAGAWAEARGELDEAFEQFDAAGDAAARAGWLSIEARANEHAADILIARDRPKLASGYHEHARRCYARWGARAAVCRLDSGALDDEVSRSTQSHSSSTDAQLTLDIDALVKMAQTMSDVTSVEDVVIALLEGTAQNAGADRGALLLEGEGGLRLAGVVDHGGERTRIVEPMPLAQAAGRLAASLVQAAASGTAPIVIDDAPVDERVASDPWVVARRPRSLLALPIVKQDERIGVLYLENSMLAGVFSGLDLQILTTLARQAAIALDNARLFDALRGREAQWRSLVENAPDFIAIVNREHRFEFANRSGPDLTIEEVLGRRPEDLLEPANATLAHEAIDKVFAFGTHESYESVVTTSMGTHYLSTRLGPIKRGDEIERVTLITADRTRQHQLEEQLRQAQKMQAIGTLAGGVAHDFNNLLTVVLGACELAMMEIDNPAEVQLSLTDIRDAASRAENLTRQLLAFSRRQVLKPERVDLNELVTGIAKLLRRLIGEHIELRVELAPSVCGVHVDPGQMEQVLMNLAVNARDAMPDGGVLTLMTRRSRVTEAEVGPHSLAPGDYVTLAVGDTGVGISAAQLGRIFEPFYTTKPAGRGTGLGLSTVLGIVEQSGGKVSVESEPGRGTRFCVHIPHANLVSERAAAVSIPVRPVLGRKVVLIVEDEPAVRSLAARILEHQGYEVLCAGNKAEAAVVAAAADTIDLLLVDVVMPGANGREVADFLCAHRPNMLVLYTSGYTDDAIVRHGVLDGSRAFLQKPFTRESLTRAVQMVLGDD